MALSDNEASVHSFLASMAEMQSTMSGREDLAYSSYEELILENGHYMVSRQFPRWERGKLGDCYKNAALQALECYYDGDPYFYYCEGYAKTPKCPIPVQHAWVAYLDNVRPKRWCALDVTWEYDPETAYLGVPVQLKFLVDTITRTGSYGLLCNDYRDQHRIIREGFPPNALCTDEEVSNGTCD